MVPDSSPPGPLLLCIDDEAPGLRIRQLLLETFGFTVLTATCGPEGIELFRANPVAAVVLDFRMPGMDGGQCARELRRIKPEVPILMLSGYSADLPAEVAGIVDLRVQKGTAPSQLVQHLRRLTHTDAAARMRKPPRNVAQMVQQNREGMARGRQLLEEHRKSLARRRKKTG